jgi:putative endonuclease
MSQDPRHKLGADSEDRAVEYLETLGYKIIERNIQLKIGEIDIVAYDGDTLVFVEVRSRTRPNQVHPATTITPTKKRHIVRCAMAYCQSHNITDTMIRFDVVAVLGPQGEIELFKNAFEAGR